MRLSHEEKLEIVHLSSNGLTQREIVVIFNNKYPERPPISQSSVCCLLLKLKRTGSIGNVHHSTPRITEAQRQNIIQTFEDNRHISLRNASVLHGVSHTTVRNIVRVSERMIPYKPQKGQRLLEPDYEKRARFCTTLLSDIENGTVNQRHILWSDESLFHRRGFVNKQNFRWWSRDNPSWYLDNAEVGGPKVMVWAGIIDEEIIGPYFFDNTVNVNTYLEMLQSYLLPELERRNLNVADTIFMQDGAPAHYALAVRQWCNNHFRQWIGRGGSYVQSWPPRSPDLTPCDFFLWGHLKNKVLRNQPNTAEEIKAEIIAGIGEITADMLRRTQNNVLKRLRQCSHTNGLHFRDKDV